MRLFFFDAEKTVYNAYEFEKKYNSNLVENKYEEGKGIFWIREQRMNHKRRRE